MNSLLKIFLGSTHKYCWIEQNELNEFNLTLKKFERETTQNYSLGDDFFSIDHGNDYFSFFKRLGEVHYFLVNDMETTEIIGTGCAILRSINKENETLNESSNKKFWYLCDLKVKKDHRGKNLTVKMFMRNFMNLIWKSNSGYLISMDPGSEQIVKIFNKINNYVSLGISIEPKLLIYSINKDMLKKIKLPLTVNFGKTTFLSLKGKKDLILQSSKEMIPLYHLQHGVFADTQNSIDLIELPNDSIIMFCLLETNPLIKELEHCFSLVTNITATIISAKMDFFDWNLILTSDI